MTIVAKGTLSAFSNISYHKEIPITLDALQLRQDEWDEMSEEEKAEEIQDYLIRLRNEDIQIDYHLA